MFVYKYILTTLAVFLTILFLGSCSVAEETAPPNNPPGPQPYMSFVLTNSNGDTVDPTTSLSRGSTYGLVITPGSGATISTADYTVNLVPAAAITINVTRTNSVDFTINNTADTTVTVTVTHKTDSSVSESVTLTLAPQADYMSFALTNSTGTIVTTSTSLSRGSTYGLVITPGSGVVPATADYVVTYIPTAAITTNIVRTNSVDFTINNTADTTVTITVAHRTDSSISESVTLTLDPQVDYMSFALTNSSGATVATTAQLSRGSTYGLVITPGTATTIPTADYIITHTPVVAITTNVVRTNSVDFTVHNTADRSITITVTHRTNSAARESITLNLEPQAPNMSFTLTNSSGATVATTAQLSRGSTYGLVITPGSGVVPATADYVVTYIPTAAITRGVTHTNSVGFTVNNTADTSVTFTVTHRTASAVSETITLNFAPQVTFQQNIENATTVPNLATANALTSEVLAPLGASAGATLVKRYVTETGGGSYNGSSWADAWAATNLRNGINTISDATANRVYLVMVAGGTYKPDYSTTATTTERAISFGMKNHVAIMGGFDPAGNWGRTGTTIFSGDIGNAGDSTDNSYQVFSHTSITLGNSHLYGVTITNGNANGSFPDDSGAGMFNNNGSSPVLTSVVFSGNTATGTGGGMQNFNSSSPVLTRVVFSGNSAGTGGGMNNFTASPILTRVIFSGNNANQGGGMSSFSSSSPVLTGVVFSGNSAAGAGTTSGGGGMYNFNSSPVIIGAVFRSNRAVNGGGMWNDNNGNLGPLIVNSIFSGNTTNVGTGNGNDIAMNLGNTGAENIRIAGSVLGIGLSAPAQPTNAIVSYSSGGGSAALNLTYHSLVNAAVRFGADATLTVNGMSFTYPTIQTGSSAINRGLFVRRSGRTSYYFSEDESIWYNDFSATGGWGSRGTPPANTEDLTATDIAGNARSGRPDAGVYELP